MGRTAERQKGSRPLFEEIEGRVLYSADGIGGLDVGLAEGDDAVLEASLLPTGTAEAHATPDQTARPAIHDAAHRREVAFIDANVPDYQRLIDDLSGADPSGRTIEVVLLDAETDGIARITHALADLGDLDAVHIISHGEDGAIQIGATRLDLMTLETRAEEVRSWGAALGENADLLVYGCDLAGSDAGRAMVDAFGALTGADMAASDDLTGAAILGGNWDLEYEAGDIEAAVAFTAETRHGWSAVLAAPTANADAVSTPESTAVVLDVLANDTDPETDPLTARVITGPSNGTLVPNPIALTNETNLTNVAANDREPSWSPDGTKIAFRSDRNGDNDIYVMNADGSNVVRLTTNGASDQRPAWSPDGSKIAFNSNRDGNDEIYVMNADGTNKVRLTSNAAADVAASWSPDGTQIAFKSARDGNDEIYVMNADGTAQTNLSNNAAVDSGPSWSPNGSTILFVSNRAGNSDIYAMDADGSNQTRITTDAGTDSNASWSPDGTKIVFKADRDGNQEIYVMDADGSSQTRLTNDSAPDGAPTWSPDGSLIAFQTSRDGNHEIYVAEFLSSGSFTYTPNPGFTGVDSFTYVANDGTGDSAPATVAITVNPAGATQGDVLFVVGDVGLSASDSALLSHLQSAGYSVTVTDDESVTASDAAGQDLVLVSETVDSVTIGSTFTNVAVPVLSLEPFVLDDLGMTGPTAGVDYGENVDTQVDIVAPGHFLAAGLSGTVGVYSSSNEVQWGAPNGNAITIASLPGSPGQAAMFAYEGGSSMPGLPAPDRRAFMFIDNDAAHQLTSDGWALFDNAVEWSIGEPPAITSDGGGASTAVNVAENATTVTTVTATDPDLDTPTFSITGGLDQGQFSIDTNSGALTFAAPPDFESPTDTNLDNVYVVEVTASDGKGGYDVQEISVTVTDVLNTLTVTSITDTADGDTSSIEALNADRGADGVVSLREAILAANSTTGSDVIRFSISGAGPHTINLAAALPTITDTVTLDGWSEPDHVDVPVVRIDGAAAGAGVTGLTLSGTADNSVIRGLMITDFSGDGVLVESGADFVTIAGNWIGTAGTGTTGVGNGDDGIELQGSNATIGGTGPNDGNVVTNSGDEGIDIKGSGVTAHFIQGNIIGLDPDGATGSGNSDVGIAIISGAGNTIGGTTVEARNVISNNYEGIEVNTDDNIIQGNYIGTDATGTLDRGNRSDDGVEVQSGADRNLIGGTAPGAGNLIAFNARDGVYIASGVDNSILGNRIHSNVGLGIDLASDGVAMNDAGDGDGGANDTQNYPVLSTAISSGGDTAITGTLNSAAGTTFHVEFFRSAAGSEDASGYGEGSVFIGSTSVTTDGSGDATFNAMLTGVVLTDGDHISATATRMSGGSAYLSTSEFGQNITATGNVAPVINSPGAVSVAENRTVVMAVTASDGNGDTPTFSITGGVDQALFDIDGGTGVLTFNSVRDFESPADNDSDNIYVVEVTAHDGYGGTHAQLISVTVTDVTPAAANDGYSVDANATLAVDWWNTDWSRRQEVSFDNLAQAETLTDFPVLVVLDSGSIDYARTNDDGSDLRFFAADGSPLAHEIEQWNEGGESSVWVRVPQITGGSNSDRVWMYYGNASAESAGSSAEVWDASFVGVWHLNEDQAGIGTAGVYQDSTGRGNNGIDRIAATGQDGQVTDGQQLGANDWIEIAHDPSLDLKDSMTISFWIKPSSDSGTFNRVVEKGLWGYGSSYYFGGGNGTNDLTFYLNGQEVIDTADNVLTVGVWQHAAVSYTSNGDGTGTARLYLDGAEIATGSYTNGAVPGNTGRLAIGHDDPSYDFDGFVDEVQISDTDRSADWIAAHYQATRNQLGAEFVQLGGEQPAPGVGGVMTNDVADSYRSTVANFDTTGTSGLVTLNADGTFSYDPNGQFDYLAAGATATDSFTYTLTDGAQTSTAATVTITITGVNDTPTGAGTLTTTSINDNAGATNLFSGLTVADVDTGESDLSLTITLTNAAAGTLSGGGFTETGPGTGVYTATGLTVAQADTALDGVTFTPTNNTGPSGTFNTDISVTVNDQGGAGEQSVLGATTVTITRMNDTPTGAGALTTTSINDNAGATNLFSGLNVADVDTGESDLSLTITLTNPAAGTLSGGGFTETGPGIGVYTATGLTVAQADTALDNVQFTPTNNTGPATVDISVTVNDQGGGGEQSVLGATTLTITGVNNDPSGTGSLTSTSINDNAGATNLFAGISISDVDPGENDLSLTITLTNPAAGTLSGGGFAETGPGTGVYTATGLTVAQADTALDNVQFTPTNNTGPSGTFNTDISVTVNDQGGAGEQSVLGATTVTITRVNDAPTGAGTLTTTSINDNAGATNLFSGLTVADVDTGESDLSLTITLTNPSAGTLSGGGFAETGLGTGVYTATGLTVAQADTALDNVQFTPTNNTGPSGTFNTDISVTVNDQGGAGEQSVLGATTVTITRVNDAPTGAGTLTTTSINDNAGATNLFSGLTVADVDTGESDLSLTITLTNAAAGTLSGGGFTETGPGTGVYTATGLTVAQADTALDGVTFTPTNNTGPSGTFNTDISVTVNDQGGAGEQGVLGATTVTITRMNDTPTGAGTLTTTSINDNAGATNLFSGLTVADVDTGESDLSLTITLTNAAAGTLSGGGFTETGPGTGVYTATGLTVAQADTALDGVTFTPTNNTGPSGTFNTDISVTVNDQGGAGEQGVLGATTVTITRMNDTPTGAGALTTTSINDNAGATNLFSGLNVADVDTGESDLSLTITLTNPAAGTLSGGGFTETGPGIGVYTATGLTVAQADTALDNVQFTPTNNTGPATVDISVTVNDQGGGGEQSVLGATTLTITGVNNDPSGTGSLTSTSINDNAGATNLFAGISISDVDPGESDLSLTITLTNPSAGTLSGGGFAETGPGTGVYTATGLTVAQADTALDNVQFTPTNNTGPSGTFNTDISVTVNDQGGAGEQSVLSATTVTITRINDDPQIISGGGGPTVALDVAENTSVVTTISATDVDGATPTLTITGGADQGFFSIGLNSGALTFIAAPDFDSPLDADGNNTYEVEVSANDGNGGTDVQTITVSVTDDNTAPAGAPIILGTVTEGQILSANTDGISDVDGLGAYSYQWLRDGVPISGATSAAYTLGQTDVSARMSVEVSYTDGSANPEGPLTSAETEPVQSLDDARAVAFLATEDTRSGPSISSPDIDRGPFEREPALADDAEASDATTSANHLLPERGASSPSSTGPAPAVLERLDSSTPSSGPATADIQERVAQVVEQRRTEAELAADSVRALPARLEAWVGFGVKAGELTEAAPASEGPSTRETVLNEALRVAMQSMRTEMADAARLEHLPQQMLDAATRITGVSASAGSVAWLMRGSSLFASVLATVPTWKGFDPLPVLDQSADDNRTRRRKRDEEHRTEDEVEKGVGRVLDSLAATTANESSSARGDERT